MHPKNSKTKSTYHYKTVHDKTTQEPKMKLEFPMLNQNKSYTDVFLSLHRSTFTIGRSSELVHTVNREPNTVPPTVKSFYRISSFPFAHSSNLTLKPLNFPLL